MPTSYSLNGTTTGTNSILKVSDLKFDNTQLTGSWSVTAIYAYILGTVIPEFNTVMGLDANALLVNYDGTAPFHVYNSNTECQFFLSHL